MTFWRFWRRIAVAWVVAGCLSGRGWIGGKADDAPITFADGPAVSEIRIELDQVAVSRLRQDPRHEVPARLRADGATFAKVGVHLKGSVGSFRPLEDKPSMTVDLDHFVPGQRWRGTTKFHLNNSIEDPSFLSEWLGSEVFRAAGIPVPQVAHAVVWLNGRRLGLYVLKEGFTKEFLERTSLNHDAIILEPVTGQDLGGRFEVRVGTPTERADSPAKLLEPLAAAASETNLVKRWQRLEATLDIDQFLNFLTLEVLLAHRDGYGLARNNFRIRLDRQSGQVRFLPHGMDQLFHPPKLAWQPSWAGLVARAVMETPEGRRRYGQAFTNLLVRTLSVTALTNQVVQEAARFRSTVSRPEAAELDQAVRELCGRIVARRDSLEWQLRQAESAAVVFSGRSAALTDWACQDSPAGGFLTKTNSADGLTALYVMAGPSTSTAWHKLVRVPPGRYRFEGRVGTSKVEPLPFGRNQGAALRVAGGLRWSQGLLGDTAWAPQGVEFEVEADEFVELLCELRASAGEAWFDLGSLRLLRVD